MNDQHQKDIELIRSMMERSTRFISLSGLSGIAAGIVAIIAAGFIYDAIHKTNGSYLLNFALSPELIRRLFIICFIALFISIAMAIYFTVRKSVKNHQKIWNALSRRLLITLFVPLAAGGIFCLALLYYQHIQLIVPSMLIFYSLGLLNASKYTFSDIEFLGYCELVLGLALLFLPEYALIFWVIGFGVLHIIYGAVMQKKYR